MADGKGIVPHKPMELAVAIRRAEPLLRLWEIDLETASTDEIRALCRAGAEAMRDGALAGVGAALAAPATRVEIVKAIDELIAAFPGMRKDADLGVFSKVLAEEIAVLAPAHTALRAATRGLIRSSTFPPTIAEVVAAVRVQQGEWGARVGLLERLPGRILEASRVLGDR